MNIFEKPVALERSSVLPEPWSMADVVVVLPTYQEAADICQRWWRRCSTCRCRLCGSWLSTITRPTGRGRVTEELADKYGRSRLEVMHRAAKEGLGRAYTAGMSRAVGSGAEFVVQMDSDLSHSPQYLPQMLGTLLSADATWSSGRAMWWVPALTPSGRFTARCFRGSRRVRATAAAAGDPRRDCGIQAVASLRAAGDRPARPYPQRRISTFQVEMNYQSVRQGLQIIELPIHFADRIKGRSKMNLKTQLESALLPFSLRRYTA